MKVSFASVLLAALLIIPARATAQEEVNNADKPDTTSVEKYPSPTGGEFTPAKGFDIAKTQMGSLNISVYGLFRYLNQLPAPQSYLDHLGRERIVKARNDVNWHRTMVWLTGFFWTDKFLYNITLWSLPTTQETLLFGNLRYRVGRGFNLMVGILPNLTARSMQGSWPYWAGSDRSMTEDFFRGGFSSGFSIYGEPIDRVYYTASLNNNLSQLGVIATNDSRDLGFGGSIFTMPTTGEFGPRGGFGDLEYHTKVATRFGVSGSHSRESRYAPDSIPPNATQIRLSDGVFPFETGALAPGVTVGRLDYNEVAFDAGLKYRGLSVQGEYYWRRLSQFDADGPLPQNDIVDKGVLGQAMYMVVPKHVGLYVSGGYIWDDFDRRPWEFGGGLSGYPAGNRSWRLNLHLIHVFKSPAGSTFGYYVAGQTGTIISIGTDILL